MPLKNDGPGLNEIGVQVATLCSPLLPFKNYIANSIRLSSARLGGSSGHPREVPSDSPRLGSPPRASAVIRAVQVVVSNSCIINVLVPHQCSITTLM